MGMRLMGMRLMGMRLMGMRLRTDQKFLDGILDFETEGG